MTELITGYHFDIGGRDVLEDRASVQEVTTPANLSLVVAVVADGVGGENKGERASQLAIDTFFHYLRSSPDADVPTLLSRAVQMANQAVHGIAHETGGASTTMAVAALHQGTTLYVANVGDSRVYLCRNRKLTQLTLDHTFANMMPLQGKMSREAAAANPRAEALMRAIGPRPNIPVDIGFYVNTMEPQVAAERGMAGLALQQGDAILVCSDGLVKTSRRTGHPFVTPDEIIRVLNTQEGESAARSLVSFALGRDADDNVSAAVLQTPDPARTKRAQRPSSTFIGVGLTLVLAAAVIVYFVLQNQGREQASLAAAATSDVMSAAETATIAAGAIATSAGEASELAQAATSTAAAAATMTAIVAAYTPTPTPTATPSATPRPTRVPNQIGIFIRGGDSQPFTLADSIVISGTNGELHVNHDDTLISEDAHIFAFPNTQVQFEKVTADVAAEAGISMLLYEGSDIFLDTGDYVNGADISPIGDTRISFLVSGSCMSVQYEQETDSVSIGCYDGSCSYRAEEREALTPLPRGELLRYDVQARQTIETRRLRASESNRYRQALLASSSGRQVYDRCILPLFPPTSTPTPTRTPTATPTRTPVPTTGSGGGNPPPPAQPSNTAVPPDTPMPTATPICLTPLPTGCQATLLGKPTSTSAGITLAWLSLGLALGLVLVFEKPGVVRRQ
jgi:protein phosphatase